MLAAIVPFIVPSVAAFYPRSLPLILVLGAVAPLFWPRLRTGVFPRPLLGIAITVSILLGWAGLTIIWSIDQSDSIRRLLRLIPLAASGLILLLVATRLNKSERRMAEWGLLIGTTFLAAQLLLEVISRGWVTDLLRPSLPDEWGYRAIYLQTGATVLSLFVWPSAHIAIRRLSIWAAALLVVAALGISAQLSAWAAVVAFAAGGMVVLLARIPKVSLLTLALPLLAMLMTATVMVAMPVRSWMPDLPASVRTSVYHRLEIWRFVAERISERPLLGWGLEASRTLPGAQDPIDIGDDALSKTGIKPPPLVRMPLHPHNGFLQLWLELGVVGVAIASVLLIQLLAAIRRSTLNTIELSPSFAVVASAVVVLSLSYGLWQSWWQSTLWLTAGIVASLSLQGKDGGAGSLESD